MLWSDKRIQGALGNFTHHNDWDGFKGDYMWPEDVDALIKEMRDEYEAQMAKPIEIKVTCNCCNVNSP